MQELPLALTFDDVLLVPRRSRIRSRADVSTRTQLTRADRARDPGRLGEHGHRHDRADGDRARAARRHRRHPPLPLGRGRGGRGRARQALPHARDRRAAHASRRTRASREARAETERLGVSGLLVVDGDGRLAGILTTRDLRAGDGAGTVADAHDAARAPRHRPARDHARTTRARCCTSTASRSCRWSTTTGASPGMVTLRDLEQEARYPQATRDARGPAARGGGDRRARRLPRARRRRCSRPTPTRSCSTSPTATRTPRSRPCASSSGASRKPRSSPATSPRPRACTISRRPGPTPSRSGSGPASPARRGSSRASACRSSPRCSTARRRRARPACR